MSDSAQIYIEITNLIIGLFITFGLAMMALQGSYYTHINERRLAKKIKCRICDRAFKSFMITIVLAFIFYSGTVFLGIHALTRLVHIIDINHNKIEIIDINYIKTQTVFGPLKEECKKEARKKENKKQREEECKKCEEKMNFIDLLKNQRLTCIAASGLFFLAFIAAQYT